MRDGEKKEVVDGKKNPENSIEPEMDLYMPLSKQDMMAANFSGFKENSELHNRLLWRRLNGLESDSEVMMEMVNEVREDRKRISGTEGEVKALKTQLEKCSEGIKYTGNMVEKINMELNKWEEM